MHTTNWFLSDETRAARAAALRAEADRIQARLDENEPARFAALLAQHEACAKFMKTAKR